MKMPKGIESVEYSFPSYGKSNHNLRNGSITIVFEDGGRIEAREISAMQFMPKPAISKEEFERAYAVAKEYMREHYGLMKTDTHLHIWGSPTYYGGPFGTSAEWLLKNKKVEYRCACGATKIETITEP